MKRDEKLNPSGDWLGGLESHGLRIHDPVTHHIVRLCLTSANPKVRGLLLYNVGYSLLLCGKRDASFQVVGILKNFDKNLAALLSSKLNKDSLNPIIPKITNSVGKKTIIRY